MTAGTLAAVLDVDGPAAPPRSNGELVFSAPWESRAFGLALALNAGGKLEWEDFRQQLIQTISEWEREHGPDEEWSYYRCWLVALERVLDQKGLVPSEAVIERTVEFVARPEGHDHRHDDHGHHHHHGHSHDHDHGHSC
ncbi:MAG TPA: nitrile hydratase accessory protein [Actinomycetota bacterium]|nr:nitrile hydratase accessory protein [Actinomycetota bacterium]